MTNHYHILIETPDANLAQGMRQLNIVLHLGVHYSTVSRAVKIHEEKRGMIA